MFEALIAAYELAVPRGKLKNRINMFLSNPLCRGVDGLKQMESRAKLFFEMEVMKYAVVNCYS
jgi:hypothetical protein